MPLRSRSNTPPRSSWLLVGITGGIGSGKSTVCSMLKRKGRTVISADSIANELTVNHPGLRKRLGAAFGKDVYKPDGSLDRKLFSSLIFRSTAALKQANSIIHPYVLSEIGRLLRTLPASRRAPYVAVEAALIFEAGIQDYFDYVVLVDAPLAERVHRIRTDGRLSGAEVRRRAGKQLPSRTKRAVADFVLENKRGWTELKKGIDFLDSLLKNLANPAKKRVLLPVLLDLVT